MSNKEIVIILFLAVGIPSAKAQQWSKADSIKLNQILKGNKEININKAELQNIQFDNKIINKPLLDPIPLNNIRPDETLPSNASKKFILTMYPYKPNTPYNWDPVLHCKIIQVNGYWEPQNTTEHFNDRARAYNMATGISSQIAGIKGLRGLKLGSVYIQGGTISGLDLMLLFEKRFWQFRQNETRKKTLEVLKNYGKAIPRMPARIKEK